MQVDATMLQGVVDTWQRHLRAQPETAHGFEHAITAPCPAQAVAEAEEGFSSAPGSTRLLRRAHQRYRKKMRGFLQQSLPGVFRAATLQLLGLEFAYLGVHAHRNVVLALLPEGVRVQDYASSWALRWELASIAALTEVEDFTLLVTGQATQKTFEAHSIQVRAEVDALSLVLDPPRISGPACRTCRYADVCPKESRQSPDFRALGTPPEITVQKSAVTNPLRAPTPLLQRLWQTLNGADPERQPGFHPSTVGKEIEQSEPCLRVFYYQALGIPQDAAWRWLEWVFVMGHAWHEVVQELSKAAMPEIDIERPVRLGRIRGSMDWRLRSLIIDGKTKSEGTGIADGNRGQLHTYLYASLHEPEPPSALAVLTMMKGTGALVPKVVAVDQVLLLRLTTAMDDVEPYIQSQQPPDRFTGAEPKHARCQSCYYTEHCWK